MEKENLDDLMRKKFDTDDPGARFEFREEYWEQAQAMLEADERKRKRRFLWWWWLGAGCLLLAVGGWFGYAHSGGGTLGIEQTIEQPTAEDVTNTQATNELDKNTDGSGTKIIESSKAGDPAGQSSAQGTTAHDTPTVAKNRANQNTPAIPLGRADVSARGSATGGAKTAGDTQTAAGNRTNKQAQTAQSGQAGKAGSKSPMRRNGQQPKSSGLLPATTNAASAADLPTGNTGLPTTAIPPQTTGLPVGNTATAAQPTTGLLVGNTGLTPTTATAQPAGLPVDDAPKTSSMLVLQKLPLIDFQALITPPYIPFFPKAPQAEREIKPLREPRFSLGLGASAAAFFPKNSAAQWGGTAGVFADYRLSRSFSLTAGVAWRYVPVGGLVADSAYQPQVSEQFRYSFGYKQVRTSIRPQGLHTLELPLALRWHRGPWYLEGGATLSHLLGVRADLNEERSASLQPTPETSKKNIWTDTQPYRQMWISPMAGAGWQRGRWSVSLRAVLFPLDVVPPIIPDDLRATGWRPSVDIGLRYRIW